MSKTPLFLTAALLFGGTPASFAQNAPAAVPSGRIQTGAPKAAEAPPTNEVLEQKVIAALKDPNVISVSFFDYPSIHIPAKNLPARKEPIIISNIAPLDPSHPDTVDVPAMSVPALDIEGPHQAFILAKTKDGQSLTSYTTSDPAAAKRIHKFATQHLKHSQLSDLAWKVELRVQNLTDKHIFEYADIDLSPLGESLKASQITLQASHSGLTVTSNVSEVAAMVQQDTHKPAPAGPKL